MTRREELFLAFLSGFLLAFGIYELAKAHRRAVREAESLERQKEEIGQYWREVGSFIHTAKCREEEAQQAA